MYAERRGCKNNNLKRKLMEVLSMKNENDKVDHLQNQIREIEMRQKKLTSQIKQISKRHEYTSRKARTHYLIQLGAAVEHVYGNMLADKSFEDLCRFFSSQKRVLKMIVGIDIWFLPFARMAHL